MLEWQLSPEVHSAGVHETTDQQLGGCSPEEGPPTFPFLMTDISGVKGRSLVLQAEPKSLQILPKDRDFFFFFSPYIYLLSQLWICFYMSYLNSWTCHYSCLWIFALI